MLAYKNENNYFSSYKKAEVLSRIAIFFQKKNNPLNSK